jgi:hypothetical protein
MVVCWSSKPSFEACVDSEQPGFQRQTDIDLELQLITLSQKDESLQMGYTNFLYSAHVIPTP